MQITFLGASHGVPEANRRCSCTLIETNGRYYFIDMGVNAIDALRTRGIEVEDVKGIFITHMHGDHTNGLISFVDLISWYFKTADPEICLPNLEGVEAIRAWLKANHCEMRDLRFKKVTDGTIFDDGDLKHPNVDFPKIAKEKPTEFIICEAAHFPATDYAPVLAACPTKQVLVNHYAPWNIPNVMQLAETLAPLPVKFVNDGMQITL